MRRLACLAVAVLLAAPVFVAPARKPGRHIGGPSRIEVCGPLIKAREPGERVLLLERKPLVQREILVPPGSFRPELTR